MTISYYDGRSRPDSGFVQALTIVNALFMVVVVLGWPALAGTMGPAIEWAMSNDASAERALMTQPYATLWLLPFIGSIVGSIALRYEMMLLARLAVYFPVVLLAMVFGWFFLTPLAWH